MSQDVQEGKIARLVTDKGFGFIQGTDGKEYFFHRSTVQKTPVASFDTLHEQQSVTFVPDPVQGQKGWRALRVMP